MGVETGQTTLYEITIRVDPPAQPINPHVTTTKHKFSRLNPNCVGNTKKQMEAAVVEKTEHQIETANAWAK